jgi:hypothetical protein
MSGPRSLALAALCALITLSALGLPIQSAAPPARHPGPGSDPAAVALDRRILAEVKKGPQIMANLTHLSDVIGARLTGSTALTRANHWTAEKMKSYGLSNVHLEAWTIPEGWERGKATARVVEPATGRSITLASLGWHPGTKGKVQGDVIYLKAETVKELDAYKGKLKNAIVLLSAPRRLPTLDQLGKQTQRGQRMGRPGGPGFGRRNFTEMMAFRKTLTGMLQKEGALAIFQDAGKPLGLLTTTGGWGGRDRSPANNRIPTLFVAHNHYEMLYRLAIRPDPARTRVELEVENKFIPGPIKVYNTVGEITGSEKPDEFVIVGAHLDSWDLAAGTTDNGTGSSIVLETARVLARSGIKPKRTIRFVLFTGEEQGLHGSRVYVEKHKEELARTSAALVHDSGTGRVKGLGTGRLPAVQAILKRELVSLRELGVTDFTTPSMSGSDHQSFARAGLPGLMLVQDMSTYTYTHHSQADTLDAANEANLIQGAQVMAVTAMRIANLPNLLPRTAVIDPTRRRFAGPPPNARP